MKFFQSCLKKLFIVCSKKQNSSFFKVPQVKRFSNNERLIIELSPFYFDETSHLDEETLEILKKLKTPESK